MDPGWTVMNFMATVALHMGCDPIICVGMDHCFKDGKVYSEGVSEEGEGDTRPDLEMSRSFMEQLVKENPDVTWINATGGGLSVAGMKEQRLESVLSSLEAHISPPLFSELDHEEKISTEDLDKSLKHCHELVEILVFGSMSEKLIAKVELEEEPFYQLVICPALKVWDFILEREIKEDFDLQRHIFIRESDS